MELSELYRIPWTKNDNPNGWIEVTTDCQLDCPGCYRGFAEEEELAPPDRMERLKRDVDTLISMRNIQCLSIAGGEPLMFPQLDELISYARSKGLVGRLYTNGVLLTEKRLRALKAAGLGEVIIHASLWQNRLKPNTVEKLIELKTRFCEMFRAVGGVRLGFIEPAMRSCLGDFPRLFAFYQKNADIVANVVFTTFKDEYGGPDDEHVPLEEVSERIVECYGTEPCAYIPKIHTPARAAWLLNVALLRDGNVIGSMDRDAYGLMQEQYHESMGKYLFSPEPETTESEGMGDLAQELPDLARALQKTIDYQVVSIVDSPQLLDDGRVDMCDSCPDAILYKGELVPKCILDRIKQGLEVSIAR